VNGVHWATFSAVSIIALTTPFASAQGQLPASPVGSNISEPNGLPDPEPGTSPDPSIEAGEASGSLRAGYWSSNRQLDDRAHFVALALWMRAAPRLGSRASVVLEGWVRSQDLARSDKPQGLLREAYLDASLGPFDLRLGKQIIVWGRADAINPTDNVSPRDLTLLVPDDADQRSGCYAIRERYYLNSVSIAAWWLPGFLPMVVPIPALPPPLSRPRRRRRQRKRSVRAR